MELISALVQSQLKMPFEEFKLPVKEISDLSENDFVFFTVVNEIIVAKLFGVFKPVSNENFILKECLLHADIPPTNIYQVQKNETDELFLQGITKGFVYN